MSIRILALVGDAFHAPGGIAQYNRDLLGAWSRMDGVSEVVVVPRFACPRQGALPPGILQTRPAPRLLSYVVRALVTSLRGAPFDFVFCAHLNLTPLAWFVSRLLRIPLWLQVHGIEAWEKPRGRVRRCVEKAALVTSVSRHTRRKLLSWANLPPHLVRVVPNTVGEQFTVGSDRVTASGAGGTEETPILLTISRLSRLDAYKGHEQVLRCMPRLGREHPGIVYVIGGDGDLRPRLEEMAESLGVDASVRFLGSIDNDALPSLYRSADAFVMPSSGEGFGIVYLESLACGTPVVAGNTDGAADPLQDGALGVLTDEESLLDAILGVLRPGDASVESGRARSVRADTVRRCFGKEAFDANVDAITSRLERVVQA